MEILIKSNDKQILEAIACHFNDEDRLQEEFLMDRIKQHVLGTRCSRGLNLCIDIETQKDITIININKEDHG